MAWSVSSVNWAGLSQLTQSLFKRDYFFAQIPGSGGRQSRIGRLGCIILEVLQQLNRFGQLIHQCGPVCPWRISEQPLECGRL